MTTPRVTALYEKIGPSYAAQRVADPRLADVLHDALGDARRVLDVGAGTGSYEPAGTAVVALDASTAMLGERPSGAAPAVAGRAERLPFADGAFDAVMAVLTVHHWEDRVAGYRELRRVAPRRVVLTYEPAVHNRQWVVAHYVPEIAALDERRAGFSVDEVAAGIGARTRVIEVPVPWDCTDGFIMAFWRRPEAFLDPAVRAATSGFTAVDARAVDRGMAQLRADLASGAWEARHGHLRARSEFDAGLRLLIAED